MTENSVIWNDQETGAKLPGKICLAGAGCQRCNPPRQVCVVRESLDVRGGDDQLRRGFMEPDERVDANA